MDGVSNVWLAEHHWTYSAALLAEKAAGSVITAQAYALSGFPQQCKAVPNKRVNGSGVCLIDLKLIGVRGALGSKLL